VEDEFKVVVGSNGLELHGKDLRSAILSAQGWIEIVDRLGRRGWPADVITTSLDLEEVWEGRTETDGYVQAMVAELAELGYSNVRVDFDEEHGVHEVVCTVGVNGRTWEVRLGRALRQSGHFRQAKSQLNRIAPFRVGPYHLERNGERETLESLKDLVDRVYELAKRGLNISRYKGLGEMNPRQLWDTTMDPERRRLLQVNIEDGTKADELFTILMGDAVEPRRNFIESNALEVRNLDI